MTNTETEKFYVWPSENGYDIRKLTDDTDRFIVVATAVSAEWAVFIAGALNTRVS